MLMMIMMMMMMIANNDDGDGDSDDNDDDDGDDGDGDDDADDDKDDYNTNHLIFCYLVQLQEYQVQLHDNHVMRGNTAVFKCNVPRFVKDYVNVTAWTRESSLLQSGMCIYKMMT